MKSFLSMLLKENVSSIFLSRLLDTIPLENPLELTDFHFIVFVLVKSSNAISGILINLFSMRPSSLSLISYTSSPCL
jgi:hypothetical protein